jgi:ribosomal protein S18 acetylase RimI-like enzyme
VSDVVLEPVADREILREFVHRWGEPGIVSRGRLWTADELKAIAAIDGGEIVGMATWTVEDRDWQIVTIESLRRGTGIGSRLLDALCELARRAHANRIWLITTNDNLDALRFYQRRDFRIVAVHAGAMAESRRIKPSIPEVGSFGIPIRDEIELERRL